MWPLRFLACLLAVNPARAPTWVPGAVRVYGKSRKGFGPAELKQLLTGLASGTGIEPHRRGAQRAGQCLLLALLRDTSRVAACPKFTRKRTSRAPGGTVQSFTCSPPVQLFRSFAIQRRDFSPRHKGLKTNRARMTWPRPGAGKLRQNLCWPGGLTQPTRERTSGKPW